ncbi:MAG: PASTA domain-containing protein, partial [Bifidobacteriaceae bacterium]|nr:PASTA domain-containing protein [Bifidobacteriaceae bacterium]
ADGIGGREGGEARAEGGKARAGGGKARAGGGDGSGADGIGQRPDEAGTDRIVRSKRGTGETHALPLAKIPPTPREEPPEAAKTPPNRRRRGLVWLLVVTLALAVGGGGGALWYFKWGPGSLVAVPGVVGQERQAAEAALKAAELTARVELEHSDEVAEGVVIAADPAAGRRVKPGAIVELVVSLGVKMATVPAEGVVGVAAEEAEAALRAAGLDGEITRELAYHTTVAEGLVLSVAPEGGQEAPHNQALKLVVSQGPEPVDTPDLRGMTLGDARAAAEKLELTVVEGEAQYSEEVAEGLIISQDPGADAGTFRGREVSVVVSLGMPFVEVPNLRGKGYNAAVAELEELGLIAKRVQPLPVTLGIVQNQDPEAGASVRKGSTVTLTVV